MATPIFRLAVIKPPSTFYVRRGKRFFDILGVIALLPFALPLTVIISTVLLLSRKGPIIFRQRRSGLHGKEFVINKFRTMDPGSEHETEFTRPQDPRITLLGRIIRPHHFDELPQLLNVLRGEMSLVGPRPRPVQQSEAAKLAHPTYYIREEVKPGLTGLGQIMHVYDHDIPGIGKSLERDILYMQRVSLWYDLRILLLTIPVVIKRQGI